MTRWEVAIDDHLLLSIHFKSKEELSEVQYAVLMDETGSSLFREAPSLSFSRRELSKEWAYSSSTYRDLLLTPGWRTDPAVRALLSRLGHITLEFRWDGGEETLALTLEPPPVLVYQ